MDNKKLRVLLVPNSLFFPPYLEDLRELESGGAIPRSWVHDIDAVVEYLDQRLQTNPPKWRRSDLISDCRSGLSKSWKYTEQGENMMLSFFGALPM